MLNDLQFQARPVSGSNTYDDVKRLVFFVCSLCDHSAYGDWCKIYNVLKILHFDPAKCPETYYFFFLSILVTRRFFPQ